MDATHHTYHSISLMASANHSEVSISHKLGLRLLLWRISLAASRRFHPAAPTCPASLQGCFLPSLLPPFPQFPTLWSHPSPVPTYQGFLMCHYIHRSDMKPTPKKSVLSYFYRCFFFLLLSNKIIFLVVQLLTRVRSFICACRSGFLIWDWISS